MQKPGEQTHTERDAPRYCASAVSCLIGGVRRWEDAQRVKTDGEVPVVHIDFLFLSAGGPGAKYDTTIFHTGVARTCTHKLEPTPSVLRVVGCAALNSAAHYLVAFVLAALDLWSRCDGKLVLRAIETFLCLSSLTSQSAQE